MDYYIEGFQMNKLAYLIFAMCVAISGCGMDEKSATQEESAGDSPVEASAEAVAVEEAEAVAKDVEEAVIPVKGSSGEIGVGSSIQK